MNDKEIRFAIDLLRKLDSFLMITFNYEKKGGKSSRLRSLPYLGFFLISLSIFTVLQFQLFEAYFIKHKKYLIILTNQKRKKLWIRLMNFCKRMFIHNFGINANNNSFCHITSFSIYRTVESSNAVLPVPCCAS